VLVPYDGSPGVQRALLRAAPLLAGHRALVVTLWWSVKPMSGMAHAALPTSMVALAARRLDDERRELAHRLAEEGVALAREHGVDARPVVMQAVGSRTTNVLAVAREHAVDAVLVDNPCGLVAQTLQRRRRDGAGHRPVVLAG